MNDMESIDRLSWTAVVARGASNKIVRPLHRSKVQDLESQLSGNVIYQHVDLEIQILARKAAAIVRQALTPCSVLFSFPACLFKVRAEAYTAIEASCGKIAVVLPISMYGRKSTGGLLVEVKFSSPESKTKAVSTGVMVGELCFKACPSQDGIQIYYDKVYQIKKFTYHGFFEGEVSFLLDVSEGYQNDLGETLKAQPLSNSLYLEQRNCFAAASFKGALPVCHWCKMAGHLRKDCPELAKRVCFSCNDHGHTAKFCKTTKKNSDVVDLHEYLRSCSRMKDDGANTSSADPHGRKTGDKTGTLEKGSASSKWASASEVIDVEMDSGPDVQLELSESVQTIGSSMCDDMSEDEDLAAGVSGDLSVGDSGSGCGSSGNYGIGAVFEVGGSSLGDAFSNAGGGISGADGDMSGAGAGAGAGEAGKSSGGGGRIRSSKKGKTVQPAAGSIKKASSFPSKMDVPPQFAGYHLKRKPKQTADKAQFSSFHQAHLTDDQILQFCSFFFPRCSVVVSKYCAIVCLNFGLYLDNTTVSLDERCVVGSVLDLQHNVLCRVASMYVPAQSSDRPLFLNNFLSLPFFSDMSTAPWLLMGDLNMNLHNVKVTGHSTMSSWFDWVRSHFDNCFPSGLSTHTQGNSRTTIDYVFGYRSLATRLVNGMIRKVPSAYTDHCLLSIDLVPARVDIGPGCWRFNPTLLNDAEFLVLLDKTVVLFFDSIVCVDNPGDGGGGEPVPVQDIWESFKVSLRCCAQQYTRGAKARLKNKVTSLQQERTILLSTASSIITSDAVLTQSGSGSILVDYLKLKELDQLIDDQIQKETRECMLRSATRWQELGERNSKYFYRVIKERQSKQTIQSLKCSATGSVLVNSDYIIREARGFYQELYTPDLIDDAAVDSLLASIPVDVVLSPEDSDSLTDSIRMDTLQDLVGHTPLGKSPGLDGLPFKVYKYLFKSSADFGTMLACQSVVTPPSLVKLLSYADDLEVFLTGPGEWPVLKSLLDCYGRASNAKVNLSKTVLVSLSGVSHAAWVDIAHSEGVEWHDSGSVGAVRYLGYPLYHTFTQLDTFLDDVRLKILRHSNILCQRNLSLRGSGLVANSLFLSQLWHILRVVSVPAKLLNSVQALIRGYLLPFWPRPSMSTMYVPQKFGGVSLVDAHLQQLSLQHIFIQRLISGPNTTDFVSPWLVRGIHSLKRITPLAQLGKILQKLPPLSLSDTWSARWFLDLPLQCVVRRALYPSDGWFAATGFLPTALHNQTNRDVLLSTWLPALYHWTIPQGRGNMVTVSGIRPGDLRWYWHPDRAKFERFC
ncbi:hypothetical protein INT47_003112 [Mucor saturninus]|uniref:CCHC-type domain-containing protein n=1 Tax=Mucor saturninus TaxID=64648 RepID=A0A8H7QIL7_9FUNG|nr:hypothetical protein INT47_003112 [Mucor saturninus]